MENNSNSSTQSNNPSGQAGNSSSQSGKGSGQYGNAGDSTSNSQAGGLNMESITGMLGGLNIPDALKKYSGSATKAISGLTTTQKVVGGALLLLGATYLTRGSRAGWMKKAGSLGNMASSKKGNKASKY